MTSLEELQQLVEEHKEVRLEFTDFILSLREYLKQPDGWCILDEDGRNKLREKYLSTTKEFKEAEAKMVVIEKAISEWNNMID